MTAEIELRSEGENVKSGMYEIMCDSLIASCCNSQNQQNIMKTSSAGRPYSKNVISNVIKRDRLN